MRAKSGPVGAEGSAAGSVVFSGDMFARSGESDGRAPQRPHHAQHNAAKDHQPGRQPQVQRGGRRHCRDFSNDRNHGNQRSAPQKPAPPKPRGPSPDAGGMASLVLSVRAARTLVVKPVQIFKRWLAAFRAPIRHNPSHPDHRRSGDIFERYFCAGQWVLPGQESGSVTPPGPLEGYSSSCFVFAAGTCASGFLVAMRCFAGLRLSKCG